MRTSFCSFAVLMIVSSVCAAGADHPTGLKVDRTRPLPAVSGNEDRSLQSFVPPHSGNTTNAIGPGVLLMQSWYDLGSNGSVLANIIDNGDGTLAVARMAATQPDLTDRATYFFFFDGASWLSFGRVETERRGWSGLAALNDLRSVTVSHDADAIIIGSEVNIDALPGFALWTQAITGFATSTRAIWPRIAVDGRDNIFVCATLDGTDPNNGVLRRKEVAISRDQGATWTHQTLLPDLSVRTPSFNADDHAMDAFEDKIGVVVAELGGDVHFWESRNNGQSWSYQNLTNYPLSIPVGSQETRPFVCSELIYDAFGNAHVFWETLLAIPDSTGAFIDLFHDRSAGIQHYSSDTGIHQVISWAELPGAPLETDADLFQAGEPLDQINAGTTLTGQPQAGFDSAGNLYLTFCAFRPLDRDIDNTHFTDVYAVGSGDGGLSWGPAVNLTDTPQSEDLWASLADHVGDSLRMVYQSDGNTGNSIRAGGEAPTNILYHAFPKSRIPLTAGTPDISISPTSFSFSVDLGDTASATLTISNLGNALLNWSIEEQASAASRVVARKLSAPRTQTASSAAASHLQDSETTAEASLPVSGLAKEVRKGEPDTRVGSPVISGSGGPDAFGYSWIDSDDPGGPAFSWQDISSVGTPVSLGDDSFSEVALPFTFPFYGNNKTTVKISSNGFLGFGANGTAYTNESIPSAAEPQDFIAAFWDDLNPGYGGTIHYHHDLAQEAFIVQYTDIQHYGGSSPYTFQVILRPNGHILLQYLSMLGDASNATVGIENADASIGLQIAFNAPYVDDSLAVLIRTDCSWLSEIPVSGVIGPGGDESVQILVNAAGLVPGTYSCSFAVKSDDPDEPAVTVPVELTVGGEIEEFALVANRNDRTLNLIDVHSDAIYGPFLGGSLGNGTLLDVVISENARTALVSDFPERRAYFVDVSDPFNPSATGFLEFGFTAEDLALTPDGAFAFLTDAGLNTQVGIIDVTSQTASIIDLSPRHAQAVAVASDGRTLLIVDSDSSKVHVLMFEGATGVVTDPGLTIRVGARPVNVAISPDGKTALIACWQRVDVLSISAPGIVTLVDSLTTFHGVQSLAFRGDGTKAYALQVGVSPDQLAELSIVGPANVIDTGIRIDLPMDHDGGRFYGVDVLAVSRDGSRAYVGNPSSSGPTTQNVAVVDLNTRNILAQLPAGNFPVGIAIGRSGPSCLCGDNNGDGVINSTDCLILLSYDVGLPIPPEYLERIDQGCGDVNQDGVTNSTDALICLSYDAGIPVPFPIGQPGGCAQ